MKNRGNFNPAKTTPKQKNVDQVTSSLKGVCYCFWHGENDGIGFFSKPKSSPVYYTCFGLVFLTKGARVNVLGGARKVPSGFLWVK